MRIVYLASEGTMPGSLRRRADAFEHDEMMAHLGTAFASGGSEIIDISWDDPSADWSSFEAALIGTTWDYQDRLAEFLDQLARIEAKIPVFNPPSLVEWNARKTYLAELAEKGAAVIPTLWFDSMGKAELEAAWEAFSTAGKLVIKQQVGANAQGQFILSPGDALPHLSEPIFVQPFRPAIQSEGELGFIFVDGELSHATQKRSADGDYRVQSDYGGYDVAFTPDPADLAAASLVIKLVEPAPLYARVDMVRGPEGGLELMELELIEPFLYVDKGPDFGAKLHASLQRRISAASA